VTRPYMQSQFQRYVLTPAKEQALKPGDAFKECASDCPEMIVVPAGSFMMGSLATEQGHQASEEPRHSVTIAKPFAVSKFELTFADWNACVSGGGCNSYTPNDEGWGQGPQPVINVNRRDALQYTAWLSEVTGKTYRLLSDSEYEYAARAGTQTVYPWGNDIKLNGTAMADCNGCGSRWDGSQTAPVGSFAPNQFGLYDMEGNIWEWTEDCVHDNYNDAPADGSAWTEGGNCNDRIVRGGAWILSPDNLRSAYHIGTGTVDRGRDLGFRVARTLLAP
jgi:formylglycine-generating enzyme required for sulfatase activity